MRESRDIFMICQNDPQRRTRCLPGRMQMGIFTEHENSIRPLFMLRYRKADRLSVDCRTITETEF